MQNSMDWLFKVWQSPTVERVVNTKTNWIGVPTDPDKLAFMDGSGLAIQMAMVGNDRPHWDPVLGYMERNMTRAFTSLRPEDKALIVAQIEKNLRADGCSDWQFHCRMASVMGGYNRLSTWNLSDFTPIKALGGINQAKSKLSRSYAYAAGNYNTNHFDAASFMADLGYSDTGKHEYLTCACMLALWASARGFFSVDGKTAGMVKDYAWQQRKQVDVRLTCPPAMWDVLKSPPDPKTISNFTKRVLRWINQW